MYVLWLFVASVVFLCEAAAAPCLTPKRVCMLFFCRAVCCKLTLLFHHDLQSALLCNNHQPFVVPLASMCCCNTKYLMYDGEKRQEEWPRQENKGDCNVQSRQAAQLKSTAMINA